MKKSALFALITLGLLSMQTAMAIGPLGTSNDPIYQINEPALRKMTYHCANAQGTPVTTPAGLNRNNPALFLWNPSTSTVNLVLLTDTLSLTAAPAAATVFSLAYSTFTTSPAAATTGANVIAGLVSNSTTTVQGNCEVSGITPGLPIAMRYLATVPAASTVSGLQWVDNINGQIVVPPGASVSVQTNAAASVLASFTWEEVPTANP